jgi:hypothetical protein
MFRFLETRTLKKEEATYLYTNFKEAPFYFMFSFKTIFFSQVLGSFFSVR